MPSAISVSSPFLPVPETTPNGYCAAVWQKANNAEEADVSRRDPLQRCPLPKIRISLASTFFHYTLVVQVAKIRRTPNWRPHQHPIKTLASTCTVFNPCFPQIKHPRSLSLGRADRSGEGRLEGVVVKVMLMVRAQRAGAGMGWDRSGWTAGVRRRGS